MGIRLDDYQLEAIDKLSKGKLLCGEVGSGKTRTALAYYYLNLCKGGIQVNGEGRFHKMRSPVDLYIITTAQVRDKKGWDHELVPFFLARGYNEKHNVNVTIDSWNNLHKYTEVKNAYFIFDEQRLVGSGAWVRAFLKISKFNNWNLLTGTPADNWSDYIPVFIANGFFRNRTEFEREHCIFRPFVKYKQVDRYISTGALEWYKRQIVIPMDYHKPTNCHHEYKYVGYDKPKYLFAWSNRKNPDTLKPFKNRTEMCMVLKEIMYKDQSRIDAVEHYLLTVPKIIVFYNYNFELDILRTICQENDLVYAEWNGTFHHLIPETDQWVYLVQYNAGAEGWNCTETDTILFYSENYSYKIMHQAAGRIDRRNTEFKDLYYIHMLCRAPLDLSVRRAIVNKKNFQERNFIKDNDF